MVLAATGCFPLSAYKVLFLTTIFPISELRRLAPLQTWVHNENSQFYSATYHQWPYKWVKYIYLRVFSILLQAGVDIDSKDNDGWTPLHAAAHWGQEEACQVLVEGFCNLEVQNTAVSTYIPSLFLSCAATWTGVNIYIVFPVHVTYICTVKQPRACIQKKDFHRALWHNK